MNNKLALILAGAAVLAAALLLFTRSGSEPDEAGAGDDDAVADDGAPPVSDPPETAGSPIRAPHVAMADDPEGDLRLEGQVIDAQDFPVDGAEVTVDANPPRQVTTEADGSFVVEGLIGRTYAVTAVAGDDVGGPVGHELTESSEPVIVRLRPGASVRVAVQDAVGDPIAGARVDVRGTVDRSAETGADGRAHVRGASPGFAVVTAAADGFGPAREAIRVPAKPGAEVSVTLALSAGAPIRGRVTTPAGDPVEGARVVAEDASEMFSLVDAKKDGAATGADGRYEIPAVAAGNVRVVARHERHPTGSSALVVTDGERAVDGVDIELTNGASVTGRVVRDDGEPAPWALVRAAPVRQADFREPGVRGATADEEGRFEIVGLDREPAQIVATSGRSASDIATIDLSGRDRVDGVQLVLDAPARIAGQVVDGAGNPVPEVHVIAISDLWEDGADAIGLRGGDQTTTDGGGRFSLTGLPEGRYRLRADRSAPTWKGGALGVRAQTGDEEVTITLEEAGAIAGRVVLDDGGGVPPAFSVAVGLDPGTPFTGDDAFEVEDVEPGVHTVMIYGPGFSRRTLREVEVEPGETTDLGTVTLTRGRSVSGRVYDASGAPVAGATVVLGSQLFGDGKSLAGGLSAFAEQMGIRTAETDDAGRYEIAGISTARLTVAAEHLERGRSHGVSVPAGKASLTVDVELRPFGSVRGRATVGGEPGRGVSIMASGKTDADQHVMVQTAGDGSFVIERVAAGEHRITAVLGGGLGSQMASRDVEVPPGEEAFVELDIEVGDIDLDVAVDTDDGTPLAAAQVFVVEGRVRAETGGDMSRLFREAEGSMSMGFAMGDRPASFSGVVPGSYSVCAIPIGGSLDDPEVLRALRERPHELPAHCGDHVISASPQAQSIEIAVPAPPPLGAGDEGGDLGRVPSEGVAPA